MIRVVLADDQKIMSEGIKLILEKDEEIKVVGCAVNIADTLSLCEAFEPDVVMMDISIPDFDGIQGTKLIKERFDSIQVIILTGCKDVAKIVQAMNNGANGYMLKDINPEELIMTVKSAAMGLSVMHKDALISFTKHFKDTPLEAPIGKISEVSSLTEREINIIKHVAAGMENKEIAKCLFLSEGTVKNAISGILKKLDLRDRIQLVIFAVKNKLV
jgi:DNA-binding NarL/FixJ family response regulator